MENIQDCESDSQSFQSVSTDSNITNYNLNETGQSLKNIRPGKKRPYVSDSELDMAEKLLDKADAKLNIIENGPFAVLLRGILQEQFNDLGITTLGFAALKNASEIFLKDIFQDAHRISTTMRNSDVVCPQDMKLATMLRGPNYARYYKDTATPTVPTAISTSD